MVAFMNLDSAITTNHIASICYNHYPRVECSNPTIRILLILVKYLTFPRFIHTHLSYNICDAEENELNFVSP